MEQKYLILLTFVIAVIAVSGIITMQLLLAVIAIAMVLAVLLVVRFFKKIPSESRPESEGEAFLAGALIALAGMVVSPWIVWAAIIGVLLIIQQSVARIEKNLGVPGKQ